MTATVPSTAYTAARPPLAESPDELRARIPGWGADLDPADRPAVPRERLDPDGTGAHWDFPDRQPERHPRERSIEHQFLPPVFGTACPPKGMSGVIRRFAYARFSEARAAHWLLLLGADRVDALESHVSSLLTSRPDNPVTPTGIAAELRNGAFRSRFDGRRVDLVHHPLDPVLVVGPWLAGGALAARGARGLVRLARRR